jgi:hypothetical protein
MSKKRGGSNDKDNAKIVEQWVNFKIAGAVKGKGRNKLKIGVASTTNIHKSSTIELKKKHLFKAINLKNSPKYGQNEPQLKLQNKTSQKSGVLLVKSKIKTMNKSKNNL